MKNVKKIASVSNECVACGTCVKACPLGAITIKKGIKAEIHESCVACGKCKMVCPACVITMVERGNNE